MYRKFDAFEEKFEGTISAIGSIKASYPDQRIIHGGPNRFKQVSGRIVDIDDIIETTIKENLNKIPRAATDIAQELEKLNAFVKNNVSRIKTELSNIEKEIETCDPNDSAHRAILIKNQTSYIVIKSTIEYEFGEKGTDQLRKTNSSFEHMIHDYLINQEKILIKFIEEVKTKPAMQNSVDTLQFSNNTIHMLLFEFFSQRLSTILNDFSENNDNCTILLFSKNFSNAILDAAAECTQVQGFITTEQIGRGSHPHILIRQAQLLTIQIAEDTYTTITTHHENEELLIFAHGGYGEARAQFYLSPSETLKSLCAQYQTLHEQRIEEFYAHNGFHLASETQFNTHYPIYANIARTTKDTVDSILDDVSTALAQGAEGIGLIGTEIVFLALQDPNILCWNTLTAEQKSSSKSVQFFLELFNKIDEAIIGRKKLKFEEFYETRPTDHEPFLVGIRYPDIQARKGGPQLKQFYQLDPELWGIEFSRSPSGKQFMEIIAEIISIALNFTGDYFQKRAHVELYLPDAQEWNDYMMAKSITLSAAEKHNVLLHEGIMIEKILSEPDLERVIEYLKSHRIHPHWGTNDYFGQFNLIGNAIERDSNEYSIKAIQSIQSIIQRMDYNKIPFPILCGVLAENALLVSYLGYNETIDSFIPICSSIPPGSIRLVKGEFRFTEKQDITITHKKIQKTLQDNEKESEQKINEYIEAIFRYMYDNPEKEMRRTTLSKMDKENIAQVTKELERIMLPEAMHLTKQADEIKLNYINDQIAISQDKFKELLSSEELRKSPPETQYRMLKDTLIAALRDILPGASIIFQGTSIDDYHYTFGSKYTERNQLIFFDGKETLYTIPENSTKKIFLYKDSEELIKNTGLYDAESHRLFLKYFPLTPSKTQSNSYIEIIFKHEREYSNAELRAIFSFAHDTIKRIFIYLRERKNQQK
jgi:hypothetical protein